MCFHSSCLILENLLWITPRRRTKGKRLQHIISSMRFIRCLTKLPRPNRNFVNVATREFGGEFCREPRQAGNYEAHSSVNKDMQCVSSCVSSSWNFVYILHHTSLILCCGFVFWLHFVLNQAALREAIMARNADRVSFIAEIEVRLEVQWLAFC